MCQHTAQPEKLLTLVVFFVLCTYFNSELKPVKTDPNQPISVDIDRLICERRHIVHDPQQGMLTEDEVWKEIMQLLELK